MTLAIAVTMSTRTMHLNNELKRSDQLVFGYGSCFFRLHSQPMMDLYSFIRISHNYLTTKIENVSADCRLRYDYEYRIIEKKSFKRVFLVTGEMLKKEIVLTLNELAHWHWSPAQNVPSIFFVFFCVKLQ